jgi:hypothetical protein
MAQREAARPPCVLATRVDSDGIVGWAGSRVVRGQAEIQGNRPGGVVRRALTASLPLYVVDGLLTDHFPVSIRDAWEPESASDPVAPRIVQLLLRPCAFSQDYIYVSYRRWSYPTSRGLRHVQPD